MDTEQVKKLICASFDAKQNAYCPYSNFRVGAALLCKDGTIIKGCNVENCAYTLGICAERSAIAKAISEGKREFMAVAVNCDDEDEFISPCGGCRQVLAEFGIDTKVYMTKSDMSYKMMTVRELLPEGFTPDILQRRQKMAAKGL